MASRPIPFSTPNSSISERSPFYRAERMKRGKAISEGIQRAREAREMAPDREDRRDSIADMIYDVSGR